MNLVFNSVFEADYAELILYFSEVGGAPLSEKFESATEELVSLLLKQPELGRPRTDLTPEGLRSFRVHGFNKYVLFYQVKADDLILLRLRYGGMNLQTLFLQFD